MFDVYVDNAGGDDCSLTKKAIENLIDEKNRIQEKQLADSFLKGVVVGIKTYLNSGKQAAWQSSQEFHSINIRHNFDHLEKLRSDLATNRWKYFDTASYVKFDVFTVYADTELMLTELLLRDQGSRTRQEQQEENFGRALIYYIKTASDWNLNYIMGQKNAARIKHLYIPFGLKPALVSWMNMVSNNKKISKRVQKASKYNIYNKDGSINWWNVKDEHGSEKEGGIRRAGLPIPIENDSWVSLKCSGGCENRWISCWGSIKNDDYCSLSSCPGVYGNIKDGQCLGEKFKIESTHNGPIKYGRHVAFKYWDWKCDKARGKGTYWLSIWNTDYETCSKDKLLNGNTNLYTRTCPGKTFSSGDVKGCKNEAFIINHSYAQLDGTLRNGDYASLKLQGSRFSFSSCHVMTQFLEKGEKTC